MPSFTAVDGAPASAPSAFRPVNKRLIHVADLPRPRNSSSSFIAITPTHANDLRLKQAPASTRSQSLPVAAAERSKASPKNSSTSAGDDDIEDWFIIPTYVCSVHSASDGLTESYRHVSLPKEDVIRIVAKETKQATQSFVTPNSFVLTCHHIVHNFRLDYSDYRKFVRTMGATPLFATPIRSLFVSKLMEDSFTGSCRRAVASSEAITKEVAAAVHDLAQIPQLAAHPTFLKLVNIDSSRPIYDVLVFGNPMEVSCSGDGLFGGRRPDTASAQTPMPETHNYDMDSDTTECMSLDDSQDCLCALYADSAAVFGGHVANEPLSSLLASNSPTKSSINSTSSSTNNDDEDAAAAATVEKVMCVDLMTSRSLLVYYTDSLFTLDKSAFTTASQYQTCNVTGFGCTLLFQIRRTCKTEWSLVDVRHPTTPLLVLQLQKHGPQKPAVALARAMPRGDRETIGIFHKSWRRGYEFQLLSELLTQGKITTSLAVATRVVNHKQRVNVVCGVAASDTPITSMSLSVPLATPARQRLHVSEGADVLLHIALAAAVDVLAGARAFNRTDFIY
ncbi:Aste57867_16215 [Aphanomyces stellatus]|uniref:Aste57867_16215 protein n=1 Tax=Aphanomyces stellatus TaxID=120398 RepID=A0A485L6T6_9STRA|nr:hypothetical protein As57867_016158 [Aphanomyces stellatus]VFT92993.1 Aste57867_16215 [Aphanomyces stellatus]